MWEVMKKTLSVEKYKAFAKTSEFLLVYSWENKSAKEIIDEMALPEYEQVFVLEAMKELSSKKDFSGMSLDRFILRKLDEQNTDIFNSDDIVFMERDE